MNLDVAVSMPAFWWRGRASGLQCRVPVHPDKKDNLSTPRHPDENEQRWGLIADAVAAVGDELAAGHWDVDTNHRQCNGWVTIDVPERLSVPEWRILRSWFSASESVLSEPWLKLWDGRHRLWNSLPHFNTQPIPVASAELRLSSPSDDMAHRAEWPIGYREDLLHLAEVKWFERTDPMNARYIHALEQAAHGVHPTCH